MKTLIHTFVLSVGLLVCALPSKAQTTLIDSLQRVLTTQKQDTNRVNTLLSISREAGKMNDFPTAIRYANEALALAQKINSKEKQAPSYARLGNIYLFDLKKYAEARQNILKSQAIRKEIGDKRFVAYEHSLIAKTYVGESNSAEAINYANQMLLSAQQAGDKLEEANAYRLLGVIYLEDLKKYPEARENILKSHAIRAKLGDKKDEEYEYSLLSQSYYYQFNYPGTLKYLYLILQSAQKAGRRMDEADALQRIGAIFREQKDDIEALKNYQYSLDIRKAINHKSGIAQTLMSMAAIYSSQGKHTKAIQNSLAALKIVRDPEYDGPEWLIPFTHTGLGNTYEHQGDSAVAAGNNRLAMINYREAMANKVKALALWRKMDANEAIAETYTMLGSLYRKQNQLPIAKDYLEKGLRESLKYGRVDNLELTYSHLAKLDSMQGDYKQAYQHYKLYTLYRDSLSNTAKTKELLQVKAQYESEKQNLLEQRAKNRQLYLIASLIFLVLVFVLIAFIQWRNNQQKQRTNALLAQQKQEIEQTLNDLKKTQTQLIHKEKMASLGELTAGIAHEIQNPLNFVNNFSELSAELVEELEEEQQKPQPDSSLEVELLTDLKDNLTKILHHGNRASNIVKGMLDHARSASSEVRPVHLNELVEEYLRLAYHGWRAKNNSFNCELVTTFDPAVGEVALMSQEIGRVLLNLFNNAFYAVRHQQQQTQDVTYQPTVRVATQRVGREVMLAIGDNGMGMSDAVKAKIFQPFFTTKPTGEGTGLGLSLSYDIITKGHGGSMRVSSQPGEGTEFTLTLPTASSAG
ncbi:hypothetical protein GCM10027341_23910 [Spirosoma knui]